MHLKLYKYTYLLFVLIFFGFTSLQAQDNLLKKPKMETSVYDNAKMMNDSQVKLLEQKLIRYSDTTSTQIVIITIHSLKGQEISMYTTALAHKWGIGQAEKDNGILILVSKDDRKMTIQTGYGVEHLLTDALSRRIIENIMKPNFKQGDFYGGLDAATTAIMQIMSGEYQGEPVSQSDTKGFPVKIIIIIIIILFVILSNKNRKNGGKNGGKRQGGFSLLDAIILSNLGRSSGGSFGGSSGGSFGGGGFGGGFGGGGFGGGGASGGW